MAAQRYRIVSGEASGIHNEPHIEGSRVTVSDVVVRVQQRGLRPELVAARYSLDIGAVYEALAYFHRNPDVMAAVAKRHELAGEQAKQRSAITPPE